MTIDFKINPELEVIHQQGVALANTGRCDEARALYFDLLGRLGEVYPGSTREERTAHVASLHLHEAMIKRDLAWIPVRRAVAGDQRPHIGGTETVLNGSLDITKMLLENATRFSLSAEALQRLRSEHGATLSLFARYLVFRSVLLDNEMVLEDELQEGRELFYKADEQLKQGSNRYYSTSNAMNAARAERIAHEPISAAKWVGYAAYTIAGGILLLPKTLADERHNVRASIKTFAQRLPAILADRDTAINQVRVKP